MLHDEARSPDSYAVPVHPVGSGPMTEVATGTVRWRSFLSPEATPLDAIEAATREIAAPHLEVVLDCATVACGGFAFRMGLELLPVPLMVMNPTDFHQRTVRGVDSEGQTRFESLLASRFGGETHVQIVSVTQEAEVQSDLEGQSNAALSMQPSSPDDLLEQIAASGRIALDDIIVGSAGMPTAGSLDNSLILDRVAALMAERTALSLVAVGHTDATGPLDANMTLSRQRAEAVIDALAARGIPRERLAAAGAAWLAPIAPNDTEAGRAANRRIELIVR
jgi:OOP family OmpA-OmpF porin